MPSPKTAAGSRAAPAQTYEERYALDRSKAIAKGAARRSQNTRKRTLEEVRATVHDAEVQVERHAKQTGREDLAVIGQILRELKYALSPTPSSRTEIVRFIRKLERTAFDPEEWRTSRREIDEPHLHLPVTHNGVRVLQAAVADRVAAGALPAEPDVTAAREMLRSILETDQKDEQPGGRTP